MPRRHLTISEANSSLKNGKTIECFLGSCRRGDQPGIKWFSASRRRGNVCLKIYETADLGDEDIIDLYEIGPLNPELELEDPDEEIEFKNFDALVSHIESKFPKSSSRFVNEGVIQDEYLEFIKRGRK